MKLNKKEIKFLIFLILLGFFLRFIWLNTLIERDEGNIGYISWRLINGVEYFDIAGNKPPLIYLTYMISIILFGNDITPIRIFNNILFLISIPMIYLLSKKFLKEKESNYSTILYTFSMNIPIFEGSMALTESFVVFWSVAAMLAMFSEKNIKNILLSIAFATIALLYKQTAIILLIIIFIYHFKNRQFRLILVAAILAFAAALASNSFFRAMVHRLAFTSITYYITHIVYIPWNYALLIFLQSLLLTLCFLYGLKIWIDKTKEKAVIYWSILALLVCLVPNAYGHYFLQLVPSFSIIGGAGLSKLLNRKTGLAMILIMLIFSLFFQALQYPDFNVDFFNRLSWSDSQTRYDQNQISTLIKDYSDINDTVLMIGNDPAVAWIASRRLYMEKFLLDCDQYQNESEWNDKIMSSIISDRKNIPIIVLNQNYAKCYKNYNLSLNEFKQYKINNSEIYIKD